MTLSVHGSLHSILYTAKQACSSYARLPPLSRGAEPAAYWAKATLRLYIVVLIIRSSDSCSLQNYIHLGTVAAASGHVHTMVFDADSISRQ